MVTEIELFGSPDLIPSDFCLWGWMKGEVYKRKVGTRDELLARILDAAAGIKAQEDQLSRTTRDLRTRVTKGIEVDCGIFRTLIVNFNEFCQFCVTNLSFKH
jgi:hypothetical protein